MILVASYNIRKAIGTDRRRRPERTLDVIAEVGADIVALQEADRRFGARQAALPLHLVAEHGGYKPVPFEGRKGSLGWHGNALLVKKHVEIIGSELVQLPSLEPRGAVLADLRIGEEEMTVIGMHLDLSGLWRRRQAKAIITHLAARKADRPVILMGDLNEWSRAGGCLRDFAHDYAFASCGKSFHTRRPVAQLDRIMVGSGLEIVSAGTHITPAAQRASDHLPIWAHLRRARHR